MNLSDMASDQMDTKRLFSLSQPELDTSGAFDIPSLLVVASNQSHSTFPVGSEPQNHLTNSCDKVMLRDPIASIPEPQLDILASSEEIENVPLSAGTQTTPDGSSLPQKPTEVGIDPLNHTAVVTVHQNLSDSILQRCNTSADSSRAISSHHHPDGPELLLVNNESNETGSESATDLLRSAGCQEPSDPLTERSDPGTVAQTPALSRDQSSYLIGEDSDAESNLYQEHSTPLTETYTAETSADSRDQSSHLVSQDSDDQEPSVPLTERTDPEAVAQTSAVSRYQGSLLISPEFVYGSLYESLFPQNFSSEVLLALLNPPTRLTVKHPATETQTITHPQEDDLLSQNSAAGFSCSADTKLTSSPPDQTSCSPELQIHSISALNQSRLEEPIQPCSEELNQSHYQLEAQSKSLIALPVPGLSPGTEAQVTRSKRRAILVRQVITGSLTPADRMISLKDTEVKTKTDSFSEPLGQTDGNDRPLSPAYLSVGSDEGSMMEVYFSAQEDNGEDGKDSEEEEEMFTVDKRKEMFVFKRGNDLQGVDRQEEGRHVRGFTQETDNTNGEETEGGGQRSGDQLLLKGNSDFLLGRNPTRQEKQTTTTQVEEEELLAPQVLQVNILMECDSAPPSSDPEWEGNRELLPPGLQDQFLVSIKSPDEIRGSFTGQKAGVRTRPGEEEEQSLVSAEEDERGAVCAEEDERGAVCPKEEEQSLVCTEEDERGAVCAEEDERGAVCAEEDERGAVCAEEEERGAVSVNICAAAELFAGGPTPDAAACTPEGAGTMTQSADGNTATRQQVPVESSASNTDTRRPDRGAAELQPAEDHSSQPPSAAASVQQADMMSSGYSSLSTKLTLKSSSSTIEEESKPRFHKVSLVKEADSSPDPGSEYRWKNRFVGVTQYKPQKTSFPSSNSSSTYTHLSSSSVSPGNSLSDRTGYLIPDGGADERRPSLVEEVEPAFPASKEEGQTEGETEWESQQLPASSGSNFDDTDSSSFTGLFTATLVELTSDPSTPPSSPDAESPIHDMDSLVDTLRSMGPSLRPKSTGLRPPAPLLISSLAPIVEDAQSPVSSSLPPPLSSHTPGTDASQNGLYTLPAELGLKRSTSRDTRSPLELMKKSQDHTSTLLNGTGPPSSPPTSSRLDSSVIFSSFRSSSSEQTLENGTAHRTLFRSGSLPEIGSSTEPTILRLKEPGEMGIIPEPAGSRLERLSFLVNSSSSGSLSRAEESIKSRISQAPSLGFSSLPSITSPTHLLSPTGSIDLHRSFSISEPPLSSMFSQGPRALQRSLSSEGGSQKSQFNDFQFQHGGSQFQNQQAEPDQSLLSKYRAFPDAYLTKEKEHGKLNPRPGKMYIFDRPGMCGQRMEVRGDVIDATPWELQETISIRVLRGGWVLYEKPNFKGEKVALDEGDIELTCPFSPPEEEEQNQQEEKPAQKCIIGSVRRAVRDYSVPEICLFPEENAEGKKVVFRDTSEDARIFGFPIKANSVIVNAGLWLVFSQPFFQGVPRILEVGGYSNPAAWGVEQPYVASLHPLKVGNPRVENQSEVKVVIYEKPYFTGKSRTISTNMKDFMTRTNQQQTVFMYSVGSFKVLGGIWVGYEKEAFRGHQYLLEEGEYHDWRVWGGCNSELRSIRIIRADLSDPLMVMFEQPEEEEGVTEEKAFEVTEAIPDVELFGFKASTHSIQVLSGAWVAYSHVDFSGNQYILEKGFYSNCADWGSQDNRVCSVQPILLAQTDNSRSTHEIILYSEPDFQGEHFVFHQNQGALLDRFITKSCRVVRGSWVLYENKQFSGNMYVLSEDDYPSLTSMGCPSSCSIRSVKLVSMMFSVPSISLFSLEGLEGREITSESEVISLVQEGFNNHILSVRVHSGCWVLCEHSTYRGRQFLLEPIEITNWPKFSSLHTIGSMFPVRQKRHFFRVKNKDTGHFLSVQGGIEEMKSGRVVATQEVEPLSDIWFYQDGLIKNKLSSTMCLQVMGNVDPAAKVVLWNETRQPIQTWSVQMMGLISSLMFPGMVLDVKGGRTYDREHVVVMPENDERPSQQWEMELL
uniref:Uncharacterized LOC108250174 n=2 Tax=Kryptolebias marmoratus TaxID=37003 RepID=A0A3Q3GR62_KRYMA